MKWEKVRLEDCCYSISDGDHQPPPKAQQGIPFVTISNINSMNQLDFSDTMFVPKEYYTSVYKGYKQDKIEMRGDRAEMSDFPLYLNTVAGGLDCRDQTIGGFSFVVKIYAVPVIEIIG